MNCVFEKKLPTPEQVKQHYPLTLEMTTIIKEKRALLKSVFESQLDKLILIIGPCSADNEEAVIDYVKRLAHVQQRVKDKIIIVPRIYTGKPRTTAEGYKGLLHQPIPTGKPDPFHGILAARRLHFKVLKETGMICADEMLYPEIYAYFDDLLGYVAVGARSVENQQHRLISSAVEVPVGMKNPTSGDFSVMMNAIKAAQLSHSFISNGWAVQSSGNPLTHAILRGYADKYGYFHANYHYEDLIQLCAAYQGISTIINPAVIIDTNHANSGKNPLEQPRIIKEVLNSCKQNSGIKKIVKGFMIESYIEDGNQKYDGDIYGKSITDACLGWDKTQKLIDDIGNMI